tara:strand:+ start:87 stop:614 length:528 start_codon:yes stop_codon:yes gene_type:complete
MSWTLDFLAVLYILFLGYNGFNKGLIEEIGQLFGLVLATSLSISKSASLSIKLSSMFSLDNWLSTFIAFAFIFSVTLLLTRFFITMLHISLLSGGNKLVNSLLGFIFGLIKGSFIIIIFVWFIALLPLYKWASFIEKNSILIQYGNQYREAVVTFFNWDDPVSFGESYIKEMTQP